MGIDENGLDTGKVWPRATARVPTPHPLLSRPYNDYAEGAIRVVIVRAGVVERSGGDPCGRPRTYPVALSLHIIMSHYLNVIKTIRLFPFAHHYKIETVNPFNQGDILKWEIYIALFHEVEAARCLQKR